MRSHHPRAATPAAGVHAGPIALEPTLSGDEALRRIGAACLDHIRRNEAAVLAGIPEGIHQMRVAVRRLRAVLSAFGKMLPGDQRRWASTELRWLADALGRARNFDVFEDMLLARAQGAPGNAGASAALAALAAEAEQGRKKAYAKAARAIRSRRYARSLPRLGVWFDRRGWLDDAASLPLRRPVASLAGRILERRRQVARRRGKGFADQTPEQRHRLRISLKKVRYATEVFAELYEAADVRRFSRRVKRLQDELGEANDIRVGQDIVAEIAGSNGGVLADAGEDMLAWHKRRVAAREPKSRKHLDRLLEAEPYWTS